MRVLAQVIPFRGIAYFLERGISSFATLSKRGVDIYLEAWAATHTQMAYSSTHQEILVAVPDRNSHSATKVELKRAITGFHRSVAVLKMPTSYSPVGFIQL